jgi:hypothetical protein
MERGRQFLDDDPDLFEWEFQCHSVLASTVSSFVSNYFLFWHLFMMWKNYQSHADNYRSASYSRGISSNAQ